MKSYQRKFFCAFQNKSDTMQNPEVPPLSKMNTVMNGLPTYQYNFDCIM